MQIEVTVKSVYGRELIYPWNEAAQVAADLVGAKTFSPRDLALLKRLGHEVVEVGVPRLAALVGAGG